MDDLISKKELLKVCDISYGQLYRWKRKKLIPEEWFIRKSTYTGQEAFFPRALIVKRIEQIKALKDEHSLDDLVTLFNEGEPVETTDNFDAAVFPDYLWEYVSFDRNSVTLEKSVILVFIDEALSSGQLTEQEVTDAVAVLTTIDLKQDMSLMVVRKRGIGLFIAAEGNVCVDQQSTIVFERRYQELVTQLKINYLRG